jgi:uncharacterized membrane protein YhaH (DUF805 family)
VPTVLVAPLIFLIVEFGGNNPNLIFIVILTVVILYAWIVFCLAAKRLHDMDVNAFLAIFVVLFPLLVLVVGLAPGTRGPNRFGPDTSDWIQGIRR